MNKIVKIPDHNLKSDEKDLLANLPIIAVDMPILYEDEGQDEVGETDIHWRCCEILRCGLEAHLSPEYRVFADLNLYYHPVDRWAYVSPDTLAVKPDKPLPEIVTSYRINESGPRPEIIIEVLSKRSAQQQDLTTKPEIYADQKIPEYILVDVTGMYLDQKLVLKTLQEDSTWINSPDQGNGVTSALGFQLKIEEDGMIRVFNAETEEGYPRPDEAYVEKQKAEEKIRQLEAEIKRLKEIRS